MTPENPYLNELLNALETGSEDELVSQLQAIQQGKAIQQEEGLDANTVEGESLAGSKANLAGAGTTFEAGFADRIMERIEDEREEATVLQVMPRMFKWIAVAGIAAAVVLLAMVFIEGDTLSIDAMSGLSEVSLADELTLEMY